MGFFSGLKKVFNPGGAVVSKVIGNGKDYKGLLDYAMDDQKTPPGQPATPFDPGQRTGASINGQSGVPQPAMRLGWTNGGYQYHNSPFNQSQGQPPAPQGPPMSFGGGLQQPPSGGSMPPSGAQTPQMGPPTMQRPADPQMMQAMMLRGGRPR